MTNLKKGAAIAMIALALPTAAAFAKDPMGLAWNGTIQNSGTNSFTILTKKDGTQTVNISSSTVIRKQDAAVQFSALAANEDVIVLGTRAEAANTINATRIIIRVHIDTVVGSVTAVSGNVLTLAGQDGKTYTVDAASAKIWAHSGKQVIPIAYIQVGDKLNVRGEIQNNSVTASTIRDLSLLKTTKVGAVSSITGGNTFQIQTKNQGTDNVSVSTATRITKGGQNATMVDITSGTKVLVKGFWDKLTQTLQALSIRILGK